LCLVEYFVGKFRDEPSQPVGAVGIAAAGDGQPQLVGDIYGEPIFIIGRASIGYFHGVGQLENTMLQRFFRFGWDWLFRVRIQVRTGSVVLPQNPAEWVSRNDEPSGGVGRSAQFFRMVKTALVPVHTKGKNMTHIGVGFHCPYQHYVMPAGEGSEFMAIPGSSMFGDTQPTQPQPFRLKYEVFRSKAGISAPLGGMDVKVKKAGHGHNQSIRQTAARQR
jgi:hypothetical protein